MPRIPALAGGLKRMMQEDAVGHLRLIIKAKEANNRVLLDKFIRDADRALGGVGRVGRLA